VKRIGLTCKTVLYSKYF